MKRSLLGTVVVLAVAAGCVTTSSFTTSSFTPSSFTPSPLSSPTDAVATPTLAPVDPAAGLPYTCGADPFDVRVFSRAPGDERDGSPMAAGLADLIRLDPTIPAAGWWLATQTAIRAQYLAPAPDGLWYAALEQGANGRWRASNWGTCIPTYAAGLRATVTWMVKPGRAPLRDDRNIHIVVVDACQSEPLDNRLAPPMIRMTPDAVLIVFTARAGRHTAVTFRAASTRDTADHCPGAVQFETTITLDEPLGDRRLLDGAHWPARDATVPLEP